MPGRDRTGPSGSGPASGRGMGPCGTGAGRGQGMGMGRGRGRGFGRGLGAFGGRRAAVPDAADERRILEEQRKAISQRLDELEGE